MLCVERHGSSCSARRIVVACVAERPRFCGAAALRLGTHRHPVAVNVILEGSVVMLQVDGTSREAPPSVTPKCVSVGHRACPHGEINCWANAWPLQRRSVFSIAQTHAACPGLVAMPMVQPRGASGESGGSHRWTRSHRASETLENISGWTTSAIPGVHLNISKSYLPCGSQFTQCSGVVAV